ncbi:MAG: hypothetical protein ABSC14_09875 [Desulfomonilia bacterium]|jgi:hypothetical protein
MLPLGTIESPEIVIGLVGRIGLDTRLVSEKIKSVLSTYSYETKILKVTSLLPKLKALPTIIDHPLEEYYKTRIAACNKLREISERNDILACLAIIRNKGIARGEGGSRLALEAGCLHR